MASNGNGGCPSSSSKPSNKPKKTSLGDFKSKFLVLADRDDNYRIPGTVQIGMPTTLGAVRSRTGTFKCMLALESPTVVELHEKLQAEMAKLPQPPGGGPDSRVLTMMLPNNGFPLGSCAGCGDKQAKEGGPLQVCARCKERKYCGRKCQKLDWKKHKHSTCVQD